MRRILEIGRDVIQSREPYRAQTHQGEAEREGDQSSQREACGRAASKAISARRADYAEQSQENPENGDDEAQQENSKTDHRQKQPVMRSDHTGFGEEPGN